MPLRGSRIFREALVGSARRILPPEAASAPGAACGLCGVRAVLLPAATPPAAGPAAVGVALPTNRVLSLALGRSMSGSLPCFFKTSWWRSE